jgi:hypothetical protein
MAPTRRWRDLTDRQRAVLVVGGAIEVVLTTIALSDLVRRPAAQVRGSKGAWAVGCVVQPFGPIAYLAWGRRRPPSG